MMGVCGIDIMNGMDTGQDGNTRNLFVRGVWNLFMIVSNESLRHTSKMIWK